MNYYYRNGDIPILILSLHGGNKKVKCSPRKPNKSVKNFVKDNDKYTAEIATSIFKKLSALGIKPYLLVNKIHRKYVDLNRPLEDACSKNCLPSKAHYYLFHHKLSETITNIKKLYGKCLIFDVHGNKHSKDMLQFGYHIKLNELRANKLTSNSFNSLDGIKNSQLANYIYKKKSLSNYFKHSLKSENISVFPSNDNLHITKFDGKKYKYYAGTKTIMMTYKDICDVVLVELSIEARLNKNISENLANNLYQYYTNVYNRL